MRVIDGAGIDCGAITAAVDANGASVHTTGPLEWQAKIGKIPVAVA